MSTDRITKLRIAGLRVIEDVTLDLSELTVLIGENGSGKSSVVEALELLRQAASPLRFIPDVISARHGSLLTLLRQGKNELSIEVWIDGNGPQIHYGFTLGLVNTYAEVIREVVEYESGDSTFFTTYVPAMLREGNSVSVYRAPLQSAGSTSIEPEKVEVAETSPMNASSLALPSFTRSHSVIARMVAALSCMEIHSPFETRALWLQRELNLTQGARWPATVEIESRLGRFGVNLPNTYQELRNRDPKEWAHTIELLRLGLGDDLRDVQVAPAGRGMLEVRLVFANLGSGYVPADFLSEGQLAYLCFVALCAPKSNRSLLVFDEPEVHLHPALMARVTWLLEDSATEAPILVATHSDGLLDALHDPATAVVVSELGAKRETKLSRLDADKLADWMRDYSGFGSIRSAGNQAFVMEDDSAEEPKEVR